MFLSHVCVLMTLFYWQSTMSVMSVMSSLVGKISAFLIDSYHKTLMAPVYYRHPVLPVKPKWLHFPSGS